jgi:uncharacterized cupredoxin-like copper-binding protein
MLRGSRSLVLAAAATAVLTAGCGTGVSEELLAADRVQCPEGSDCYDPPRAVADGGSITMTAGDFYYTDFMGEVAEGDIEITIDNVAAGTHNIVIDGTNQGSDELIQANGGESATGVYNLFAGEYAFYCTIPGHRAAGMEGTIAVQAEPVDAAEAVINVVGTP